MKRWRQLPPTGLGKAVWVAAMLIWLNLPATGLSLTLPRFGTGLNIFGVVLLLGSSLGLIMYLLVVLQEQHWQGFTQFNWRLFGVVALGYVAVQIINKVYLTLTPTHTTANNATIMLIMQQGKLPLLMMVVYGVILAPLQEELLFRGALLSLIKPQWVAVIVSSGLFSCMHESSSWASFIVYWVMGVVLASVRLKANSLTASWLLHLLNNAPLLLMWALH